MSESEIGMKMGLLDKIMWAVLGLTMAIALVVILIGVMQNPGKVEIGIFVGFSLACLLALIDFVYSLVAPKPPGQKFSYANMLVAVLIAAFVLLFVMDLRLSIVAAIIVGVFFWLLVGRWIAKALGVRLKKRLDQK